MRARPGLGEANSLCVLVVRDQGESGQRGSHREQGDEDRTAAGRGRGSALQAGCGEGGGARRRATSRPLSEHLILSGYTRVYGRLSSVSPLTYLAHVAVYMACVEFGVYWQHRKLHEVRWAYQWLHRIHHVYNKDDTLSPFAGLAFHPIDGLMQAAPYVWSLFLTPCHYFTHEVLLFLTGVWTANIHDSIDGQTEPIMGAAYHTIHHVTYKHNYGHYTTLFDWMFGTLQVPVKPPPGCPGAAQVAGGSATKKAAAGRAKRA